MKTSAAAAEMKAVAACGPRDSAPWGRPQEGVQKKKGLFGNPFRRLSSNASEPKEPFEFHLVRDGKKEDLSRVKVGGLKDIGELTEAVIDAGKDPKWTMFTVKVFGSEDDAKAGKKAVREEFKSEGRERRRRADWECGGQLGVEEKLESNKTYFILVPPSEKKKAETREGVEKELRGTFGFRLRSCLLLMDMCLQTCFLHMKLS